MSRERDRSIDMLRGVAVSLMVVAHAIYFRYGLSHVLLMRLMNFANTFCFTTFLFCFGYGMYYSYVSRENANILRIAKRTIELLLTYYLAAVMSMWSSFRVEKWSPQMLKQQLGMILSGQTYPMFTEYLIAFSLLIPMVVIVSKVNKLRWGWSIWISLLFVPLMDWISRFWIGMPRQLYPILGMQNSFTFPILRYLPVVLIGVWQAAKPNQTKIWQVAYLTILITLMLRSSFDWTHLLNMKVDWLNVANRWPPSVLFLTSSLSYTYMVWLLMRWITTQEWLTPVSKILEYFGQHALGLVVFHLFILFGMRGMGLAPVPNQVYLWICIAWIFGCYWYFDQVYYKYAKQI